MNKMQISPEIQKYRNVQKKATQNIYQSTCHFLKIDNDVPKPHASGVFVKIENNYFMFTAAHVVDDCENDIYIGVSKGEPLLKLGGQLVKNVPQTTRECDKIDAAVMKLSHETVEKIKNSYKFINIDNLGINHQPKNLPLYVSLGFPASMSKYNRFKNELISKPYNYITMCNIDDNVFDKLNCDKTVNIICHYDKNNVVDYVKGEKKTGPDPFGISGSGLWFIPTEEVLKTSNINKKLVAILTEWPTKNRDYWIGTRIDIFIDIIRQKFNIDIESFDAK